MAEKKAPDLDDTPRLVRATKMVFYGGMRIRAGQTFTLVHPATEFSASSMALLEDGRDDLATAVASSPKQRGSAGVTLKTKATGRSAGTLDPDPGI